MMNINILACLKILFRSFQLEGELVFNEETTEKKLYIAYPKDWNVGKLEIHSGNFYRMKKEPKNELNQTISYNEKEYIICEFPLTEHVERIEYSIKN